MSSSEPQPTSPALPRDVRPPEDLARAIFGLGALRREIIRLVSATGLHANLSVLGVIHRHPGARVKDIAEHGSVDLSVASRQVTALEAAGYVARAPAPGDGRSHALHLTPDGVDALRLAWDRVRHAFGVVLADWDDADVETLSVLLLRLQDDFESAAGSGSLLTDAHPDPEGRA